jgi:hypothetical protein
MYPSALLIRKDVLTQIGGFNENMPAAEDWEACLKLSRVCDFVGIPEKLVMYRVTGTGLTANPLVILNSLEQIVSAATDDLPSFRRFIESHRLRCERMILVATTYRQNGDSKNCLRYAFRAFTYWPSPFYGNAVKVFLLELRNVLLGAPSRPLAGR